MEGRRQVNALRTAALREKCILKKPIRSDCSDCGLYSDWLFRLCFNLLMSSLEIMVDEMFESIRRYVCGEIKVVNENYQRRRKMRKKVGRV